MQKLSLNSLFINIILVAVGKLKMDFCKQVSILVLCFPLTYMLHSYKLAKANQNAFRIAISKWYDYNKKERFNSYYFNVVNDEIKQLLNIQITFDSRYADAIRFWINFKLCSAFKQTEQHQLSLVIYFQMASQLCKQKVIGKRHMLEIQSIKPFQVVQKIAEIIQQLGEGKVSVVQLEQKWEGTFGLSLLQFWQVIMLKQIKHAILVDLYKVTEKAPIMLKKKNIKKYIEDLKSEEQNRMHSLKGNSYVDHQFKEQEENILHQKTSSNQSPNIFKIQQIHNPQHRVVSLFSQLSLNPNFIKLANDKLQSISYKHSLFRNPAHAEVQKKIQLFVNFAGKYIFKHRDYTVLKFGSLKSTLALANEYDIDITFLSSNPKNNERQVSVRHLFKINQHLKNILFSWYKSSRVYHFPELAIPYLKIEVDELEFKNTFSVENTTKIDITIGNRSALLNSDLLLHFARIPQIQSFCILVKFWAKARKVVNLQSPMRGLSSYMLMLMCIYYLMESGQIDFLQPKGETLPRVETKVIIPNLKRIQVRSIFDNFTDFLQFYKQGGRFMREKKVVCLLKKGVPQGYEFNENFIVNAYDFIDKGNPGRLLMKWKDLYYPEFERALMLLKSKNLQKIDDIFEKY